MVDLFIDAGALCVVCNRYMAVTPRECRVKMNLRVISTNLKIMQINILSEDPPCLVRRPTQRSSSYNLPNWIGTFVSSA